MEVVWFKRDLRLFDHAPLHYASQNGPVLLLYVIEPDLWQQPDASARQFNFLRDCLIELANAAKEVGQTLVIRTGDILHVLADLHAQTPITRLWSHQETGNDWTFKRDLRVKEWTNAHGIPWQECIQHSVFRRLKDRDDWQRLHQNHLDSPLLPLPPLHGPKSVFSTADLPTASELRLPPDACAQRQTGGRSRALQLLESFLANRAGKYMQTISKPLGARHHNSRLSPYLAYGCLSMREVHHRTQHRRHTLTSHRDRQIFSRNLSAFTSRLHWHCHFIQKLEDDPRIEFENMHHGYDGLREHDFNDVFFQAWKTGHTGYPMVDACMRSLHQTGWLNFRMRALLMSFSSQHLWLHWREPALHLARLFSDYEPGIHFAQCQMQSGTTGINAIRIYNPIKQGMDNDPTGQFIRTWVPELRQVSAQNIHTPWREESNSPDYPRPIVEEATARKRASALMYQCRKDPAFKREAKDIVKRHASRKRPAPRRKPTKPADQFELPF